MGSAQSRNERRRASSSIDNERPPVRRRLDPLRRLSNLGRGTEKRDRGQSIEPESEERDKRQRTGSGSGIGSGDGSRGSGVDDAGESSRPDISRSGSSSRTQSAERPEEGDPLALERTQSIEAIRQVLGNDWTPPLSRRPTPTPTNDTTTPASALMRVMVPARTRALPTAPGPPLRTRPATTSAVRYIAPTPPRRQIGTTIPTFTPTPNLVRRWSGTFESNPNIFQGSEDHIPLTRSQSSLPHLRFRSDELASAPFPRYYRDEIAEHLRILSNQRLDMRERLERIRAAVERSDPVAAAQEAESARRAFGLPRPPAGNAESGQADAEAGVRSPGSVLMIQGLAQMQSPPTPEPVVRRRFGRRSNPAREHVTEQANMIANLLTVASAATATTLWSTAEPRTQPTRILETLMRRIRPRRPFSVRRHLGSYIYDSIGTANRRVVVNDPSSGPHPGNDVAASQFMDWLETIQTDLIAAMTEFSEGSPPSLSRRNTEEPLSPSSSSFDLNPSFSSPGPSRRVSEPPTPSSVVTTASMVPPTTDPHSIPSFHRQEGQNRPQGSGSVTAVDEYGARRLNFFRAHIFPPTNPNDTTENPVVPCVFVGVRSLTHDPNQTPDDLLTHPSFPFSNGQVPSNAGEGGDTGTADVAEAAPEVASRPTPTSPAPVTQSRAQSLRSRLMALSPFARHSANTSITSETGPDPSSPAAPTGPTTTFIVYVVGGNYPRNHPILSIPSLITGAPLTDEEMVLVGELMGQVKPPTATAEEVEKSGLKVFDASLIKGMVDSGEVLDGSAERCLVCLCDFESGEECRLLGCRHLFHKDCVDQWIKVGRNACPACRTEAVDKSKSKTKTEAGVGQEASAENLGTAV